VPTYDNPDRGIPEAQSSNAIKKIIVSRLDPPRRQGNLEAREFRQLQRGSLRLRTRRNWLYLKQNSEHASEATPHVREGTTEVFEAFDGWYRMLALLRYSATMRILLFAPLLLAFGCSRNPDRVDMTQRTDLGTLPTDGDMAWLPAATTHVVYRLSGNGHVYRVDAHSSASPEDVTSSLDGNSPGDDSNIGISRDGGWLSLTTTRFGCGTWACLALVATSPAGSTATTGSLITTGGTGALIHPENRVAVARDAAFVIYSSEGYTHTHDLLIARRTPGTDPNAGLFDAPKNLTADSTFDLNDLPALAADENSVVFDCQTTAQSMSAGQSQNLCVVNIDGTNFQPTVGPTSLAGFTTDDVHSGDYLPDGTLVFEASWHAEQVWHRDSQGNLVQIAPQMTNDNSPCALPDGRVASLWLERVGNPMGFHELKVSSVTGDYEMVVIGQDIDDIGIGCGQ
jgi:hypothetical protein